MKAVTKTMTQSLMTTLYILFLVMALFVAVYLVIRLFPQPAAGGSVCPVRVEPAVVKWDGDGVGNEL
jgi:hypothetical protein